MCQETVLPEMVGRRLMIGFDGEEFTPDLENLLLQVRPGGLILFKRNVGGGPGQIAALVTACQDLAGSRFGRPLLVAIDQEGGPVRRLGPPFFELPSQRAMADKLSLEEVRGLGEISGRELAAVGINMNLTPVLDLNTEPGAGYMAERSFGPDPDLAAALGLALIQGHASAGVMTCAKHFPGIGDTRLDPHHDLPTVTHPASRMKNVEIKPFAQAVQGGAAAVMSAHVRFPALDPARPGTFSPAILTDLLRSELGFDGLVLTDDLEMGAVIKHYEIGPAAVLALTAGADLVLVCHRPDRILAARDALIEAVRSGEIPGSSLTAASRRLEEAWSRITLPESNAWREVFDPAG